MKTHPFAVISLVCGLASFLLFCFTAVPGIVFGALALSKIRAEPAVYTGRNLGLWGIVLNCLSLFGLGLILPNLFFMVMNSL